MSNQILCVRFSFANQLPPLFVLYNEQIGQENINYIDDHGHGHCSYHRRQMIDGFV